MNLNRFDLNEKKLEQYFINYTFTDSSLIRRSGEQIWIPEVYCHNGHSLICSDSLFDGLKSIHLQAMTEGKDDKIDFYLSPVINDPRKMGPEYTAGTRLRLFCPSCQEELRKLIPCTCRPGVYRRAVYLTPKPDMLCAVGICENYGCPQSFVTEDGELLWEVILTSNQSSQ